MPQQRYEVRGLKFISYTNDMAVSHRCTFAISLRLPSGSYWVAHYLFLDDAGYSGNVRLTDPRRVVAKGTGANPGYLTSDAVWPKEVIEFPTKDEPRTTAKLRYSRRKGTKAVVVQIDVWAKRIQTVQFGLVEVHAPSANSIIELHGKVSLSEQTRDYRSQILDHGPWGSLSDPDYRPT